MNKTGTVRCDRQSVDLSRTKRLEAITTNYVSRGAELPGKKVSPILDVVILSSDIPSPFPKH